MLTTLAVSGYRSLRDFVVALAPLTVVTGPNGAGKSSLYRSLRLLADVAQGRAIASLAAEGGLQSTLWAGPENISRAMRNRDVPIQGAVRRGRVALKIGFADEDYGYAVDLGLPVQSGVSAFNRDPEIKAEGLWAGQSMKRSNVLARRMGPAVTVMMEDGTRETIVTSLPPYESMMTHVADPQRAPEVLTVRERMRAWRFYDAVRTDQGAPARATRIGTRTFALSADGADLAAAVQTIREIGDGAGLDRAIDDAFEGAEIAVEATEGLFGLVMHQPGILRPLSVAELSDGTLRYLCLAAALMTPRPPPLIVLNEPETSLHPDLLPALGRLIVAAAASTQIIVVSHAPQLVEALVGGGALPLHLTKAFGETSADDHDRPPWNWPKRGSG